MTRRITALPSVFVMPDGSEKELNSLSKKERENWNTKICQRIGNAISERYADCIQEWNIFTQRMTSDF